MRSGLEGMLGKTISGVIVKKRERQPASQLFLLFEDGTYYEFYSMGTIGGIGNVLTGGATEIHEQSSDAEIVFETLPRPERGLPG